MPTYCYRREDNNELIELSLHSWKDKDDLEKLSEDGRKYIITEDNKKAYRDISSEKSTLNTFPGNWPQYSNSAGVPKHQIAEAKEYANNCGVPTNFTSDGRVEFRSRGHRKKFLKVHGMIDRDAGYSD